MDAAAPSTSRFFERHAWKIFVALSLIVAFFGVTDLMLGGSTFQSGEAVAMQGIAGTTWEELLAANPPIANLIDLLVRTGGASLLIVGLLSLAVCLTGFRRGERWAWLTLWVWPLWTVLVILLYLSVEKVPGAGIPVPVISGSIIFVISVATLGLSYRKYFPT